MDFHLEDEDYRVARRAQLDRQIRLVWILSLAGLIPFVASILVVLVLGMKNPLSEPAIEIFRNYSVVILSFLGGIRWGHALLRRYDERTAIETRSILFSVVPSLVAWSSMFFDNTLALGVLILAYSAQGAWDSFASHLGRLPKWFGSVRMIVTGLVVTCHIVLFLISA